MHVQVKTSIAPPEHLCARIDGVLVHDDFRAKNKNDKWIYEAVGRDGQSLAIPPWIDPSTITVSVHDAEQQRKGTTTIICSTTGRPLTPYYTPKNNVAGMPDACFSLAFPYINITYLRAINYFLIRSMEPAVRSEDGGMTAYVMTEDLFSGAVRVKTGYCPTCRLEFDAIHDRHDLVHNVVVSAFELPESLTYLNKAMRAAAQKAWGPKPSRSYYIHNERRDDSCSM